MWITAMSYLSKPCCKSITLKPTPEASHSIVKLLEKSGNLITKGSVIALFSCKKAQVASSIQKKVFFFDNPVNEVAIIP